MKNKALQDKLTNTFKYTIEYDNYFDDDNDNGTFYTNDDFEFIEMVEREVDFAHYEYGEQFIDLTINGEEHYITVDGNLIFLDGKVDDDYTFLLKLDKLLTD